uniref:Putative tick transposon n=1 Tax=Rhipicephalus microplus TaxID=6941 RepID=A0A6G4ZW52_RHIMP
MKSEVQERLEIKQRGIGILALGAHGNAPNQGSCGLAYVGTTKRDINQKLKEHHNKVQKAIDGHSVINCKECGCVPYFDNTCLLYRDGDLITRLIVEAAEMTRDNFECVSAPSISLTQKELCLGMGDR